MSIDVIHGSSAYLHIGDVITLFCEGNVSGFIGTLRMMDDRCIVKVCDGADDESSKISRDSLFEVYPLSKYHAQNQYNKKKFENGSISPRGTVAPDDGLLQRLKNAVDKEREQNLENQRCSLGQIVRYGETIQLCHRKSLKFLSSNTMEPATVERNANKIYLDPEGGPGSWFCIEPFYKHCSVGDNVAIGDRIRLLAMPSCLGHVSFGPSQRKHELHVSNKTIAECPASHEVNCLSNAHNQSNRTSLRISLFLNHHEQKCSYLKSGDIIRLFHVEQQRFLTMNVASTKVFLRSSNQAKPTDATSTSNMWEVEVINPGDPYRGSPGRWSASFKLKNTATDTYLSFDVDTNESGEKIEHKLLVQSDTNLPHSIEPSYFLAPFSSKKSPHCNTIFGLDPCTIEQPENVIGGTAFARLKNVVGYVYGTKIPVKINLGDKRPSGTRCVLKDVKPVQEAFHIMPVGKQEIWNLDFGNDAFFLMKDFEDAICAEGVTYFNYPMNELAKLKELIIKLIRFVASDFDGDIDDRVLLQHCDKQRQKWMRELGVLHQVLYILQEANKLATAEELETYSAQAIRIEDCWREVFKLCNLLVRLSHKEYRKNRDFIIEVRMFSLSTLIGKRVQVEQTMMSLVTGNKTLPECMFDKCFPDGNLKEFLIMTVEQNDPAFLINLSQLCVSPEGQVNEHLQVLVFKAIVPCDDSDDEFDEIEPCDKEPCDNVINSYLIQTEWEINESTGERPIMLQWKVMDSMGEFEEVRGDLMKMAQNCSKTDLSTLEYYRHQLYLFGSSDIINQYPVDLVLECMSNPILKTYYNLRASFTRLMLHLHVDCDPQTELPAIRHARLYQNICESSVTKSQETKLVHNNEFSVGLDVKENHEKFRKTIQFVQKYLREDAQLQHSQGHAEYKLTLEVIRLAKSFITFGFFSLDQMRDMTSDLLNIFCNEVIFEVDLVMQINQLGNATNARNFKYNYSRPTPVETKTCPDLNENEKSEHIILQTKILIVDILEYLLTVRLDYQINRLLVQFKKSNESYQSAAEFDGNLDNLTKLFIDETFTEQQGWLDLDEEGNLKMLRILLSFAMHQNLSLVCGALRLLNRLFSQREEFIAALTTVQLLVSQTDVDRFNKIRKEKQSFKHLIHEYELWIDLIRFKPEFGDLNYKELDRLPGLDYMDTTVDKTIEQHFGPETRGVVMKRILKDLKAMCEDTTDVVSPNRSGQNLLRNMCVYESVLEFLSIATDCLPTGSVARALAMFQVAHEFLRAFCVGDAAFCNMPDNVVEKPMEFETLCAIYKDNSELCDNVPDALIHHVLHTLAQLKYHDRFHEKHDKVVAPEKLHTSFLKFLEVLATFGNDETKRKVAVELESSLLREDNVLRFYNGPKMIFELVKLFHQPLNLDDSEDPLAYHIKLIDVMKCCVDGHINIAEIKCASMLRLTDVHRVLLRDDLPIEVRRAYLDFLTHCYVDTEAEVFETNSDVILIQEIIDHMIISVQSIIDSEKTADAEQYVINSAGKFLLYFIRALRNHNSPLYNKVNHFHQRLLDIIRHLSSSKFNSLVKSGASNRALKKLLSDLRVETKNFPDLMWVGVQEQVTAIQLTKDVVSAKKAGLKFMRHIKMPKAPRKDFSIERSRLQQVVDRVKEYLDHEVEAEASVLVDILQDTHIIFNYGKRDPIRQGKENGLFLAKLVGHAKSFLLNKQMESLCARIFRWLGNMIQPIKHNERSLNIRNKLIKTYVFQKELEMPLSEKSGEKIKDLRIRAEKKAAKMAKLLTAQEQLENAGACQLVIAAIISDPSGDVFQEAIRLANALLHKGNINCQKSFINDLKHQQMNCDNAIDLVASISEEFFRVLQSKFVLAENKLRSLYAQNENLCKRPDYSEENRSTSPRSPSIRVDAFNFNPLAEDKRLGTVQRDDAHPLPPEAASMELVLRFLQLLCENHNTEAQLYLLKPNTKTNYDLVTQTLVLLDVACGSTTGSLGLLGLFINENNCSFINQILITLTEYCQGPCKINQTVLAANETNGLDIIIALILSKISPLGDPDRCPALVLELRYNASKLLLALMESRTDSLNAERILTTISRCEYLDGLVGSVKAIYKEQDCSPETIESYKIKPIKVGHKIYILTKLLAKHDETLARLLKLEDQNLIEALECRTNVDTDEPIDEALLYYAQYTANIEIAREDGELEQIIFPVPEICNAEHLPDQTKLKIYNEVEPDPQGSKVDGFVEKFPAIYMEMQWQKKLNEYGKFAMVAKNLKTIKLMSYFFAIVLNLIVALYFPFDQHGIDSVHNLTSSSTTVQDEMKATVVTNFIWIGLCILSLAVCWRYNVTKWNLYVMAFLFLRVVIWLGFWPNFYLLCILQIINKIMHVISYGVNVGMWRTSHRASQPLYIQMYDVEFVMLVASVLICLIGLWGYPLCYALLLLDIVYREETLQNVVRSVTRNWKSIAWTTLLALILVYEFAIIGHLFLKEDYPNFGHNQVVPHRCTGTTDNEQCSNQSDNHVTGKPSGPNSLCNSLASCIVYTIHCGLRNGGGIGDCLETVKPDVESIWWHYSVRIVFDLGFFFLIIVIVLNLIFGVIIDTFADLRSEKQESEDMLKNTCFICGLHRAKFENKAVTFEQHVDHHHNLWNYFYFWIMLQEMKSTELTGPESYVFELLNDPKRKLEWFPRLRTASLDVNIDTGNMQIGLGDFHAQLVKDAETMQYVASQLDILNLHNVYEMRRSQHMDLRNANSKIRHLGSSIPAHQSCRAGPTILDTGKLVI